MSVHHINQLLSLNRWILALIYRNRKLQVCHHSETKYRLEKSALDSSESLLSSNTNTTFQKFETSIESSEKKWSRKGLKEVFYGEWSRKCFNKYDNGNSVIYVSMYLTGYFSPSSSNSSQPANKMKSEKLKIKSGLMNLNLTK